MMPVITKNDGFPITLKVPAQRFSKRFHTDEEVGSWISAEIRFWDQLNQYGASNPFPTQGLDLGFLRSMTSDILRNALSQGSAVAQLSYIEAEGVMLSEGNQAKFLSQLKTDDPALYPGAFAALASTLTPIKEQHQAAQGHRYPMPWSLWMSGLGGLLKFVEAERSGSPARIEFEQLADRARDTLSLLETQTRDTSELYASNRQRLDDLAQAHLDGFKRILSNFETTFEERLDHSRTSIEEFETMVRERLALEAPTKFWTEKAQSHRNVAIGFGIVFLAAIGCGVYWITHYGVSLVAEADKTIVGDRANPGLLALVPLAFITLPTLAFAWILRHISRIVVQNVALQADAQLRGTIANTYTALTSQTKSTPAELAIALNALFRPIDGSGHAEIAPPNIRDILEAGK